MAKKTPASQSEQNNNNNGTTAATDAANSAELSVAPATPAKPKSRSAVATKPKPTKAPVKSPAKPAKAATSKKTPADQAAVAENLAAQTEATALTETAVPLAPSPAEDAKPKPETPIEPSTLPPEKPAASKSKQTRAAVKKSTPAPAQSEPETATASAQSSPLQDQVQDPTPASTLTEPETTAPTMPSEAEFLASQGPLPAVQGEDEAAKIELLHEMEAQFELIRGVNLAIEDEHEAAIVTDYDDAQLQAENLPEPSDEPAPEPEFHPPPEPQHWHQTPASPPMYIVQITPELSPVAKVGGLADVVFGLSNELEIRGNSVEIILPKYDCLRYDHIWGLCEALNDLWVPWYDGAIHCTVFFGFVHGRKCFFIEPHSADNFFNRGSIYGFKDDVLRFAFFTRAAMEFLWKTGKNPEIIHCHDWQTALAPVFLFEIYQHLGMRHPRVCLTIHNFKHQGLYGAQLLQATGLNRPEYFYHYDRLRDNHNPHAVNLMKAGVVYSNFITTVSPRHAIEAKDQGQGFGLEQTLHIHHQKFGGVVNGIDYAVWNPEIDPYIPVKFSANHVDGKYGNKRALRNRLLLADNEKPIVAFVGRLDPQKGLELIRHALFYTLHHGGQFVLLGSSPEAQINNYFWGLKHQLNDNPDCHIEVGYNEELAHLIYAGSDLMVVPSRFEPCGLAQLIAMRYGSIPVVREVGGLADTVFDKDHSHKPLHERNGYVFRDYDEDGLESALGRAISCYYSFPTHFRHTLKNAMRSDYSWNHPGQDYVNIFNFIREK